MSKKKNQQNQKHAEPVAPKIDLTKKVEAPKVVEEKKAAVVSKVVEASVVKEKKVRAKASYPTVEGKTEAQVREKVMALKWGAVHCYSLTGKAADEFIDRNLKAWGRGEKTEPVSYSLAHEKTGYTNPSLAKALAAPKKVKVVEAVAVKQAPKTEKAHKLAGAHA